MLHKDIDWAPAVGAREALGLAMQSRLSEFERHQLSVVARVTPHAMAGHILNTTVLALALAGSIPGIQLIIWCAYSYAIALVVLYRHLRRRGRIARDLRHAVRRATIYAFFLALPWSAIAVLYLGNLAHNEELILVALGVGMAASGTVLLSALPSAAMSYMSGILIPSAAKCLLFLNHQGYVLLGVLALSYWWFLAALISKVTQEISDRKRADVALKEGEVRLRLLVRELDHRVKNVLATVIAVSQRTRDGRTSMDDFLSAFDGRIQSMADAHSLLSGGRWQGVNLAQLVHQELAPCMAPLNTVVDGPDIVLAPDATQPVALVLHELVTNAAKYGALSSPKGHVSVEWRQQTSGHAPGTLLLDWKETGGPPIPASISPGYGTSVIKELIPYELGGAVDLVFAPEGVRCRLEIPQKWLKDANRPLS
jgi:two-component sensor histidine kinase